MITLTLLAILAIQTSQPPIPGGGERQSSQPQTRTGNTQEEPAADPRGTDASPLVVKVQPTPKTGDEAAKEEQQEQREASAHRWTVASVVGAIIIGLLQLAAIGFQAYIAKRQNSIIETQTEIMRLQERAANSSAIAASAQTEHMKGQLDAAKVAADAAKVSADALKIVHRQWLEVKHWDCSIARLPGIKTGIMNATIRVAFMNTSPLPLTIRAGRGYINGRKGGYAWVNTTVGPNSIGTVELLHMLNDREKGIWHLHRQLGLVVAGWVHYWDAFGDPQEQMFGAKLEVFPASADWRDLADLPHNLRRMARKDPFDPIDTDDDEESKDGDEGESEG
jgi:hypothetical protein